jgi:hypothetical protein
MGHRRSVSVVSLTGLHRPVGGVMPVILVKLIMACSGNGVPFMRPGRRIAAAAMAAFVILI